MFGNIEDVVSENTAVLKQLLAAVNQLNKNVQILNERLQQERSAPATKDQKR